MGSRRKEHSITILPCIRERIWLTVLTCGEERQCTSTGEPLSECTVSEIVNELTVNSYLLNIFGKRVPDVILEYYCETIGKVLIVVEVEYIYALTELFNKIITGLGQCLVYTTLIRLGGMLSIPLLTLVFSKNLATMMNKLESMLKELSQRHRVPILLMTEGCTYTKLIPCSIEWRRSRVQMRIHESTTIT